MLDAPVIDTATADHEPDPEDPALRSGRAPSWDLLLAVGIVVALGRWWFASDRRVFHLAPDEAAQLAMARWLAGGTHWNMFDHSTWRPGLATLVSPVYWFTDDGTTLVRAALAINAVAGGVAAIVLARLAARTTTLRPWECAAAAIAIALLPPALSGSSFVWAEALVTLSFVGCVWFLLRFVDEWRVAPAVAAIGCAIGGFVAHSRMLAVVGPAIAVPVLLLVRRRRWAAAATVTATGLLGTALAFAYSDWFYANVWEDPAANNTTTTVVRRLEDPIEVADAVVGQIWYQLAWTFGLAGVGLLLVVGAVRRGRPGLSAPAARILLVLTLPSLALSAVFMSARTRPDHLVYGRYNDAILWPVLLVAAGWLVAGVRHGFRRRDAGLAAVVAAVTVATGAITDWLHGDEFAEGVGVRAMVPGLLAFVGRADELPIWHVTAISLVVACVGAVLAVLAHRVRGARVALAVLVLAAIAVGALRTHHVLAIRLNSWEAAREVRAVEELVPPQAELAVKMVRNGDDPAESWERQRQRYQLYQLYLPDHRFQRDRGVDDSVGPYVFAPTRDPALVAAGATVLWTDPSRDIALWEEPITP